MNKKTTASEKLVKKVEMDSITPAKKTLSQIANKINSKLGANGSKAELGSKKKGLVLIPSGVLPLDYRLLLAGAESSWKSTICLRTIAQAQKAGGTAAYIDAERTFDPKWAKAHGVDLDQLLIIEPETAEQAYNNMTTCILEGIDVVVLDSLNTLSVKKEIYADDKGVEAAGIETEAMGVAARKTSQWLRNNLGRMSKSGTLLLVITQLRDNLNAGMYGNPNTVTGGRAIKFASSITLATRQLLGKTNEIRDENDEIVGKKFEFKVDKNKTGRDGVSDQFDAYGSMLDNYNSMMKIGVKEGFISRPNNKTYVVNGVSYNGKNNMLEALVDENTGVYAFCEKALREIMGSTIYQYDPYAKSKEIEEALAVEINDDDDGVLIPDEELEALSNNV
jgi:recombination protein RecA